MANNKRSGGKNLGLKVFAAITSLLLAASVITTGVCFGTGVWQVTPQDEPVQEQPDDQTPDDETPDENETMSGMTVGNIQAKSMSLMSVPYALEGDAATEGKTAQLTATVLPEGATDKTINWSVSWQNSSDSWASGKSVSDYVTLSATTGSTITVTNSQAFGEEIIVRAEHADGVYATCELNYIKPITDVGIVFYNESGNIVDDKGYMAEYDSDFIIPDNWQDGEEDLWTSFALRFEYGTGTVTEDYTLSDIQVYGEKADVSGATNVYPFTYSNVNNYEDEAKVNFSGDTENICDLWGLNSTNYDHLRWMYNNSPVTATFYVTITGNTSGRVTNEQFSFAFEADNLYVPATSVNVSTDGVVFF